jgi:hypothetical protein
LQFEPLHSYAGSLGLAGLKLNAFASRFLERRGEACRAHAKLCRRIDLRTGVGQQRIRSNYTRLLGVTCDAQARAPGVVYRPKTLQAVSSKRCIEQRAGCLPWLPHEVSMALLNHLRRDGAPDPSTIGPRLSTAEQRAATGRVTSSFVSAHGRCSPCMSANRP